MSSLNTTHSVLSRDLKGVSHQCPITFRPVPHVSCQCSPSIVFLHTPQSTKLKTYNTMFCKSNFRELLDIYSMWNYTGSFKLCFNRLKKLLRKLTSVNTGIAIYRLFWLIQYFSQQEVLMARLSLNVIAAGTYLPSQPACMIPGLWNYFT